MGQVDQAGDERDQGGDGQPGEARGQVAVVEHAADDVEMDGRGARRDLAAADGEVGIAVQAVGQGRHEAVEVGHGGGVALGVIAGHDHDDRAHPEDEEQHLAQGAPRPAPRVEQDAQGGDHGQGRRRDGPDGDGDPQRIDLAQRHHQQGQEDAGQCRAGQDAGQHGQVGEPAAIGDGDARTGAGLLHLPRLAARDVGTQVDEGDGQ